MKRNVYLPESSSTKTCQKWQMFLAILKAKKFTFSEYFFPIVLLLFSVWLKLSLTSSKKLTLFHGFCQDNTQNERCFCTAALLDTDVSLRRKPGAVFGWSGAREATTASSSHFHMEKSRRDGQLKMDAKQREKC